MRREQKLYLVCFVLAAMTLLVYWPVRNHDFILYDDPLFIIENPYIRAGVTGAGLRWALSATVADNWHPVTLFSHMLDCEFFGVNPGAHHLVNVGIHMANTLLLFLVWGRLTNRFWPSAVVAAIFALHPLHVESVAWIAERKDVLSACFMLLTLWAYSRYVTSRAAKPRVEADINSETHFLPEPILLTQKGPQFWYGMALLFFALGLGSKAMLVTVPFVILLLDVWPLRRIDFKTRNGWALVLKEKAPFLALAAGACWITLTAHKSNILTNIAGGDRLTNAVTSCLAYLGKTFWPAALAIEYPHPGHHFPVSYPWPAWQIGAGVLLLVALSAFCILQVRRRPYLAVGWFWYLGTLVPVLGLVQVGNQAMADRYTYIPQIGFTIAVIWLAAELWPRHLAWRAVLVTATTGGLVAFLILTPRQLAHWRNTITLMEHAVAVTPDNPKAHLVLGNAFVKGGEFRWAMIEYRTALAIDSSRMESMMARHNLAVVLRDHNHFEAAEKLYRVVLTVATNDMAVHAKLAELLMVSGKTAEATVYMAKAVQLHTNVPPAWLNDLAWTLATSPHAEKRNGAKAVQFAELASQLTQQRVTAIVRTLAAAYAEAGRFAEAVATADAACQMARIAGDPSLAKHEELLELFKAGKPYREAETPTPP